MLTVSHTRLYILCYSVEHETGGLIDGQAYSHLGDASFALATHRRRSFRGFATDEELQAAADEAVEREWQSYVDHLEVNPHEGQSLALKLVAYRNEWIKEHSWVSDKDIPIKDGDGVCLHIEERWSISDYTCWVREIEVIPRSEQSKLRESFVQTRESKVCSADVTHAYEHNT